MVPVDALEVENVCLFNDHHVISFVSENQSFNLFWIIGWDLSQGFYDFG